MRFTSLSLLLLLTSMAASPGCGDDDDAVEADGDADADADADADGDSDGDGDADTVCEDPINGCGYDSGCNGMLAPDGQCTCSRERPQQTVCLPDQVQTTCDTCLSFGAVAWFCAHYGNDGWRWRRADDTESWYVCTEDQRCDTRGCHGAGGEETWTCDGAAWVAEEVPDC